ncbi:uncharacterized protein LOC126736509 isoform X2 [Anthonomus grandis grandis]|uniref:uncharacterized protein LOC126736509 isoform X2 n=1 Tax=Anthonomus grandis grandis TaxID=2921223 RepID=UPI00216675E9|nr:uncharacterized protein LOC126736509 isoform X2 [Anthonomus grandis grandis]
MVQQTLAVATAAPQKLSSVQPNSNNMQSNSKTIPNIADSNSNNLLNNKNFGVPINSIPSSNIYAKNDEPIVQEVTGNIGKKLNLPEVGRVATFNSKPFNPLGRTDLGNDEIKYSAGGDSHNMAKSIDMAQSNMNSNLEGGLVRKELPSMDLTLNANKQDDFDKIQGLVIDNTNPNDKTIKETLKRRQLTPYDNIAEGFDQSATEKQPLNQESIDLSYPGEFGQQQQVFLNPSQPYELIEHSTRHILIIPVNTTECRDNSEEGKKEEEIEQQREAEAIGEAIAQEIQETTTCECDSTTTTEEVQEIEVVQPDKGKARYNEGLKRDVEKRSKIKGRVKIIRKKGRGQLDAEELDGMHEEVEPEGLLMREKRARKKHLKKKKGKRKKKKKKKKKKGKRMAGDEEDLDEENRFKRAKPKHKKIIIVKKHKGRPRLRPYKKVFNGFEEDDDDKNEDEPVAETDVENRPKRGNKKSKKIIIIKKKGKVKNSNNIQDVPEEASKESMENDEYSDLEDADGESDRARRAAKKRKRKRKKNKRKKGRKGHKREDLSNQIIDLGEANLKKQPNPRRPTRDVNDQDDPSLVNFYDLNESYEMPGEDDFIPAFKNRQLKSIEAEYDPAIIQDVGNRDDKEIEKFKKEHHLERAQAVMEVRQGMEGVPGYRKKFQDYSEEEDSSVPKSKKKFPIKKTKNRLAFNPGATTEDNDDDYNYSDLSDMEDEKDEDVSYYEENNDKLDVEEASHDTSEHENDKLIDLDQVDDDLKNLLSTTAENNMIYNIVGLPESILLDAKNLMSGAHAHGQSKTKGHKVKKKKRKQVRSVRGHGAKKRKKHKEKKRRRTKHNKGKQHFRANIPNHKRELNKGSENNGGFQAKSLTDREKQEIFLKYNPEFQRWPRLINDQRRSERNLDNPNPFPISNEYLLNPKLDFVKRQEPSEEPTPEAEETSETNSTEAPASETVQGESVEASSSETSSEAANEGEEPLTTKVETASNEAPISSVSQDVNQAAQEVLETINSDVLESTGVAFVGGAGEAAVAAASANSSTESSTKFVFTTIAEDLTEDTNCDMSHTISICPEDTGSHVPITVTSVLPLIQESATGMKVNITKDEFLDLNEIVGGELPRFVVRDSLSSARGSVRHGLKTSKYNMNLQLANFNSSAETGMILNEMTNLMLKLKYHTTCQSLPANLLRYVKIITQNEMDDPMWKIKEMNDIDFDEHQSNYVFRTGQTENIQDKVDVLKELLNRFNNLPADCKERAEPVKEYIMSHLNMANQISGVKAEVTTKGTGNQTGSSVASGQGSGGTASSATTAAAAATTSGGSSESPKVKKEINQRDLEIDHQDTRVLDDRMMEEGLLNQNADANEVIEDQDKKSKRDLNNIHGISTSTSPQYGRLAEAVRSVKNKRAILKRISQIYGRVKGEVKRKTNEKGFEQPRVIDF